MTGNVELLRIFCAAAAAPSFREAAARLGISPQGVTRAVRELEEKLGEPLFHRNTRHIRITAFGQQLAQRGRQAMDSLDALFQTGGGATHAETTGLVRVAAPGALGRRWVMRALGSCSIDHPGLVLDLRLTEARVNAVDEQIDVGVRLGVLRDSRIVARPVRQITFHVVAAPALLRRSGTPCSVAELRQRPLTALIDRSSGRPWLWEFRHNRSFQPNPAFITDDPEIECDAALQGIGFAQLPSYLALPHLRSGQLVSVLDDQAPAPWQLYVYRMRRTPVPARIRLVYDRLAMAFGAKDQY